MYEIYIQSRYLWRNKKNTFQYISYIITPLFSGLVCYPILATTYQRRCGVGHNMMWGRNIIWCDRVSHSSMDNLRGFRVYFCNLTLIMSPHECKTLVYFDNIFIAIATSCLAEDQFFPQGKSKHIKTFWRIEAEWLSILLACPLCHTLPFILSPPVVFNPFQKVSIFSVMIFDAWQDCWSAKMKRECIPFYSPHLRFRVTLFGLILLDIWYQRWVLWWGQERHLSRPVMTGHEGHNTMKRHDSRWNLKLISKHRKTSNER